MSTCLQIKVHSLFIICKVIFFRQNLGGKKSLARIVAYLQICMSTLKDNLGVRTNIINPKGCGDLVENSATQKCKRECTL